MNYTARSITAYFTCEDGICYKMNILYYFCYKYSYKKFDYLFQHIIKK
jgi:hypothetical protein